MLQQLSQSQRDFICLWYLVQHSLSSFYKLLDYYGSVPSAIAARHDWAILNLHRSHVKRVQEFEQPLQQAHFEKLLHSIQTHSDFIVTFQDDAYPQQLLNYVDKPPLIFGQGQLNILNEAQIAIVGSRKPSPHGRQVAYDFAYYLSEQGFYINSGLALGIDEAAHLGGLQHGRTLAVMATGLDQTYPRQHHNLRTQILDQGGTVITEFLPFTPPLQHNFPRRNRIVSGLSLGVLVAEATLKSGSLITAKIAAEQGKSIFAIPGHIYSDHHQGCHQLIREGATLVDHPEQIVEDLALATQWQHQQLHPQHTATLTIKPVAEPKVPAHLQALYTTLDWQGQSLDQLCARLQLDAADLTAKLMELELFGLAMQQSGLYLRCGSAQ
ncbi:DNA-processing protein DprA [uncultured Acinetobacter sp.]|uniref:DNA-processing protein DprA n=1 Tax=uncultured Acinetobacter sp. TaxID=165433 RepID=UPI0026024C6A|nr:DNA-processing protein DprA [uncultured Acinetobacter sp.]